MSDNFEILFLNIETASTMDEIYDLEQQMAVLALDKTERLTLSLLLRVQIQNLNISRIENLLYDAYDQLGIDRKIRSNTFEKRLEKEIKEGKVYSIADLREKKKDEPEI